MYWCAMTIVFISSARAWIHPMRRPVMPCDFDMPPTAITFGDIARIDTGGDSYQISRYTSSLTTSGPRSAISRSLASSMTAPSGFDGELTTISFVFEFTGSLPTFQVNGSRSYGTGVAPQIFASVEI